MQLSIMLNTFSVSVIKLLNIYIGKLTRKYFVIARKYFVNEQCCLKNEFM